MRIKLNPIKRWLEADGWHTEIAWGKARGTDIVARRNGETWLIEAKGCGSRPEMRVNYFIAMLGEVLQRLHESGAVVRDLEVREPQLEDVFIELAK